MPNENLLNFRQVKSDIGDNFAHAWELMCTVVESFICLLVISTVHMKDLTSKPKNAPENIENAPPVDKAIYFENICKTVVEKIWKILETDSLQVLDEDDGTPIFCCGQDIDEDMIGCEGRSRCINGEFFHYSCAGVDPENRPVPWFCSEKCRTLKVELYTYCICGQDLGRNAPMIGCNREALCTRREWYHMTCVGVDPDNPPQG